MDHYTTERDYADKAWLKPEDSFQLIDPQTAGALMFFALAVLVVLERAGLL